MIEPQENIAIVGTSPRNSYFTKDNLAFVIKEGLRNFSQVSIYVPGALDRFNYEAYGCQKDKARAKATSLGDEMKHAVQEVCVRNGFRTSDQNYTTAQVRIIDWSRNVENTDVFKEKLAAVIELYHANEEFKRDMRQVTRLSLETRMEHNAQTKKQIQKIGIEASVDRGVNYILGEFAFLEAAPALFGSKQMTYIYHREWDVYQKYIRGDYGCAHPSQNFRLISAATAVPG